MKREFVNHIDKQIRRREMSGEISEKDRAMAKKCLACHLCKQARRKQRGFAFWFVKKIEGGLCPYCKAYERVYGRKAHEPIPTKP
jgi:hypothetical protein